MPAKRRPGRFRRWLLRPAIWGAVLALTIILLAVQLVLESDYARWYARNLIERSLEGYLQREVELVAVDFALLPLGLEIEGLTVGGDQEGDPPFAVIERVLVDADVQGWPRPLVTLRRVRVERPRLYLEFRGEGEHNMLRLRRGPRARAPGERPVRLAIAQLEVVGGELVLEQQRIPLDLTARGFEGILAGGEGFQLQGRATARDVEVQLPRARPFLGSVGVRLGLERGRGRVLSAIVSAPDVSARVEGHFQWKQDKEVILEVLAEGRAAFFRDLGYLEDQIRGPFRLDGSIVWRPEAWGFRGDLTSPALEVFTRRVEEVSGVVSGDRNGVRVDIERAIYGRGSLKGVVNARTRPETRSLEVDLILEDVDLQRLIDDQGIPARGLLGRVSGIFDYRFPFGRARQGRGWADLRIAKAPRGEPGAPDERWLPVEGSAPLLIEEGVIRTEAGQLGSDAQRLLVEGHYDLASSSGRFGYRITSERIGELARLLPVASEAEAPLLWLPTSGMGELEGELELGPEGPSTRVRLALLDVEAPGAAAREVRGGFVFQRLGLEDLRLELLREDAGMIVTGSVPTTSSDELPFQLALDAAGWPAAEARAWLPFALPLEGRAYGSLVLGGSVDAMTGSLESRIEAASLAGLAADRLDLEIDFGPDRIAFRKAELRCPAGEIRLSGSMEPGGRLDLELRSDPLDLAAEPLSGFSPGALGGRMTVSGELSGSLDEPRLGVDLVWDQPTLAERDLEMDEGRVGRIDWDGARLSLKTPLPGVGRIEGAGRLDPRGMDLELDVNGGQIGDLGELVTGRRIDDFDGRFSGRISATADFALAGSWLVEATLAEVLLEYSGRTIRNLEPVELGLTGDGLEVRTLYLGEEGGDDELIVAGMVLLEETGPLDLNVEASLGASWLEPLLPDLGLRDGRFEVLGSVTGNLSEPRLNGQGVVSDGRMVARGLPHAIEDVGGVVLFYPTQIVVDRLEAAIAGGTLKVSGVVDPFAEPAPSYRLQGVAESLAVRYPEGWLMRGDAELVLASTEEGREIRGTFELDRAFYLEDVSLGLSQVMQGVFGRRPLEVEETNPLLLTTELNIAILGPGALRVRNNLADLRGGLDLIVRGSLAQPVVFGRVDIEPGGTLVYGGNEYEVRRGQLSFANPFRIEPKVDLVATTEVREYDVTLNLAGTMDRLNANFASDPPLANLDVLALLTTGEEVRSGDTLARQQTEEDSVGAEGLLYGQASSLITERVNQLFGLDRFRIDPLTGPSGNLSSARVTVGKRLSRDVFATYSYDPSTTEQQILQLEWQVNRGLTLVLTQNGDDSFSVDVRWEKSF